MYADQRDISVYATRLSDLKFMVTALLFLRVEMSEKWDEAPAKTDHVRLCS